MSLKPITKSSLSAPAFSQRDLYLRGLEHVRTLASRTWTDHNVHDPGITTLELLCYALTDLSYRAAWPLQDLLAAPSGDNAEHMRRQFYSARRILPNRALTIGDFRKLLIDLPGVKNAWIRPAAPPVPLFADLAKGELTRTRPTHAAVRDVDVRGLYRVLLEYMDDVAAEGEADVDALAMRTLQANRNLCEDFIAVDHVEEQGFQLCGEFELAPGADTARVVARILDVVHEYLAPPVLNYSLDEMLQRRKADGTLYTVPEIFEGPALVCGFIDDEELERAELRTEVRLSDVISLIMDIDGVRAVRDVLLNPVDLETSPVTRWVVPVAEGRQPVLDAAKSRLVLYKRGVPVVADAARVAQYRKEAADAARTLLEDPNEEDIPIPQGTYRKPDRYYSFQNHFPAVYGLGDAGWPSEGDAATRAWRRACAFQLKAYLLFFDQIMADYASQTAHVADLFSTDPDVSRTYFAQLVESFPDHAAMYKASAAELQSLVESIPGRDDRRQRFLDHLGARVGERFHEYVQIMESLFGASDTSLVVDRCEFLADYPELGAARGLGYDASLTGDADLWDSSNIPGLQRRVSRLLGLPNVSRRSLTAVAFDAHAGVTGNAADGFGFEVRDPETGEVLLASAAAGPTEEDAAQRLRQALERGQLRSGYALTNPAANDHSFNVVSDDGDVIAAWPGIGSPDERNRALALLMEHLRDRYSREGLHVIENILLLPANATDQLLPACVDPNCTDCAEDDPYSYRVHVILPAYAGRFRHMEFRRFVEEVIREETPANVLPKVCWISEEDMGRFEPLYRGWLELRAGREVDDRGQLLKDFIERLFALKNVYPVQKLTPCGAAEGDSKFILGQTALGSAGDLDE